MKKYYFFDTLHTEKTRLFSLYIFRLLVFKTKTLGLEKSSQVHQNWTLCWTCCPPKVSWIWTSLCKL